MAARAGRRALVARAGRRASVARYMRVIALDRPRPHIIPCALYQIANADFAIDRDLGRRDFDAVVAVRFAALRYEAEPRTSRGVITEHFERVRVECASVPTARASFNGAIHFIGLADFESMTTTCKVLVKSLH